MCTLKCMNADPATLSTALTKCGLIDKVHQSMLSLTRCSLDGKQQLTTQVKIILLVNDSLNKTTMFDFKITQYFKIIVL